MHPPDERAEPRSEPSRPRRGGAAVAQVRGVLAERVAVSTPLDPFLSLRALAAYSGLAVRTLRTHLSDPAHPLPCYRVGGKIVVRRSEFDTWVVHFRHTGSDVAHVVDDVLRGLGGRRA